jgi:hypothetical protein
MTMIYVKTKEGRRAFYEGRIIPNDKFIPVTDNPAIRRLIDHWQDVEVEGAAPPPDTLTPYTSKRRKEPGAPIASTTPHQEN